MYGVEIVHAISTLVAMEVGCIEKMIAEVTEEYAVREIAMERLDEEIITSNFA